MSEVSKNETFLYYSGLGYITDLLKLIDNGTLLYWILFRELEFDGKFSEV
jgi:hypothetical protein